MTVHVQSAPVARVDHGFIGATDLATRAANAEALARTAAWIDALTARPSAVARPRRAR